MSNSPLVQATILSPNHSGRRNQKITKIAIHHAAGVISGRNLAGVFVPKSRRASANYNLGSDGVIVLGVDESNRAWTTSSGWCDNRAVTIEVGNSTRGPQWLVSDYVLNRLIDLVTDICRRNGIYPCTYTGGKGGVLQKHEWYSNTNCPGPYLGSKFPYIANEVNKRLRCNKTVSRPAGGLYRVRKSWSDVKSQKGAFKNLDNAKKCVNANPGYAVYDVNGRSVYPVASAPSKSVDTLAREVIAGNWGNGQDRVNRLTSAGYNYNSVQNRVNEILSGVSNKPSGKSIDTLAREVIRGDWGNGQDRKNRLERTGYDYDAAQKRVNELL
ncbi:MAG: N-acetylmuramoyl-L-alanine amidase [Anaerococcus vaginalis]|nr:N-acetylmuramoyl-L-alanine amidase [Anaerococcus vaginalis]MDU6547488.1 N-acetylmuramoyl-L-alanine amidase [Anaerococcus vaginalis]